MSADGPRRPTVHGAEVSEFCLIMRQGEQAWFLAGPDGNHEFARIFWLVKRGDTEARYHVRDASSRVGPSHLEHVALDSTGATLSWSCGRKSNIPHGWYQVTWRA